MYRQLGLMIVAVAVLPLAAPATAQEGSDTVSQTVDTLYRGVETPVWLMVSDVEGQEGVHRVLIEIKWDDDQSGLPFADAVEVDELVVLIPIDEGVDEIDPEDVCRFSSEWMEHGSEYFQMMERVNEDCYAPVADRLTLIGLEHVDAPFPMACKKADRTDGDEEPTVRYFACYWVPPVDMHADAKR